MASRLTSTFQHTRRNRQNSGKMTAGTAARAGRNQNPIPSYRTGALTILGIVLTGLAVFRSALTWHLQRLWVSSGHFWQAQWDKVLDTFGEDPFNLYVYGAVILTVTLHWLVGGVYTILDITNKPAALRRYKIQPGTNEPVETKRLLKVILVVVINQTVVNLLAVYLNFLALEWRGFPPVRKLPTFRQIVTDAVVFVIVEEIGFYYAHRLLHHRHLYRFIHKKHHEWTAPVALTAQYCNPIEQLFANSLPILLGIFLMGSHVATAYLWLSAAMCYTLKDHSGYNFPFLPSAEAHDFHHFKINQCYGVLGILDRLHGTDKIFRSARRKKLLNAISASAVYAE